MEHNEAEVSSYPLGTQGGITAPEVELAGSHQILDNLTEIYAHLGRNTETEPHGDYINRLGNNDINLVFERVGRIIALYMHEPVVVCPLRVLVDD